MHAYMPMHIKWGRSMLIVSIGPKFHTKLLFPKPEPKAVAHFVAVITCRCPCYTWKDPCAHIL